MNQNRFWDDLAYGCFLFCGAGALTIGVMGVIPMDSGTVGVMGFAVAIPLALAQLAVAAVGVVSALRLWRPWPLPLLAASTILFAAVAVTETGPAALYNAAPVLYGIVSLGV